MSAWNVGGSGVLPSSLSSADQPGLIDRSALVINDDTENWAGFEAHATAIHNIA